MARQELEKNLEFKLLEVEKFKNYENNPRIIDDDVIDRVAKSIEENGFTSAIIVDKNYQIIAGHTRLAAAKKLGFEKLPAIISKVITEEQSKKLRLLDNRLSEMVKWDTEKLSIETIAFDDDFRSLFAPLMEQDFSDFDFSDDDFEGGNSNFANEIIQYVLIFDNAKQQDQWYKFLAVLKDKYPKADTHAERLSAFLKKFLNEKN